MSGGGSSKNKTAKVAKTAIEPVPQAQLQTTGFGGMGFTPTPQSYTAESKPAWMQGAWNMPQWGMSAANPQQALTQEMLQPAAQQAATQQATAYDAEQLQALIDQLKGLSQEEAPKDPRAMSTNNFLKAYLFKRGDLEDKIRAYDEYQYEKAQGRQK